MRERCIRNSSGRIISTGPVSKFYRPRVRSGQQIARKGRFVDGLKFRRHHSSEITKIGHI